MVVVAGPGRCRGARPSPLSSTGGGLPLLELRRDVGVDLGLPVAQPAADAGADQLLAPMRPVVQGADGYAEPLGDLLDAQQPVGHGSSCHPSDLAWTSIGPVPS